MTPFEETLFCSVPPNNSLVWSLTIVPLWGLLSRHVALQGALNLASPFVLLPECWDMRHKDTARSLSKTIDANLECVIIKTNIFTLILDCKKQTKRKSYWPELTLTRQKERDGDHVKGPQSGLVCCFRLHRETKTLPGMACLALRSQDPTKNNWRKLWLHVFF